MSKKTHRLTPPTRLVVGACLLLSVVVILLSACNVTRTVTTQSQFYQKGDTTCTIVTKTVETYDATKH